MAVDKGAASVRVSRIQCVRMCSARAEPLADFYESALGFRRLFIEHLPADWTREHLAVSGRALQITMELGAQRIALLQFVDQPGRDYPRDTSASDTVFQHFAIVVTDMEAAMAQLSRTSGWAPISIGGPQKLPASSGSVTAFKFRDPEGHPLELLAFRADSVPAHWQNAEGRGPFIGIDHSAISVADSARSIAFYESLGLVVSHRSLNNDPIQALLDHLEHPVVEVTTMSPGQSTPRVELLCYRGSGSNPPLHLKPNDVAATCLVFQSDKSCESVGTGNVPVRRLVDLDGHHLAVVD